MSKNLEYAIMIFLAGLLVILFRWSENGKYDVISRGSTLVNTRSGIIWTLSSSGKALMGDYKPALFKPDPRIFKDQGEIADELNKEYEKAKE